MLVLDNVYNLIHIIETKNLKHITKDIAKNALISAGLVGSVGSIYNQFMDIDDQMNLTHSMILSGGMGAGRALINAIDDDELEVGKKQKTEHKHNPQKPSH